MTISKKCVKCDEVKPFTEEYFHKHIITGKYRHRSASCIECHKKKMRAYNKESYSKNRSRGLVGHYKRHDRKKGWGENDLTEDWFERNINTQSCTYCGTKTEPIGMDRIDNNKGHYMENVVPCCSTCNKVKNNIFTVEEMKRIGKIISDIRLYRKL